MHIEPITIVAALIREGCPEAAVVLESPLIRNDLRLVCSRNWPGNLPVIIQGQELTIEPTPEQNNLPNLENVRIAPELVKKPR